MKRNVIKILLGSMLTLAPLSSFAAQKFFCKDTSGEIEIILTGKLGKNLRQHLTKKDLEDAMDEEGASKIERASSRILNYFGMPMEKSEKNEKNLVYHGFFQAYIFPLSAANGLAVGETIAMENQLSGATVNFNCQRVR